MPRITTTSGSRLPLGVVVLLSAAVLHGLLPASLHLPWVLVVAVVGPLGVWSGVRRNNPPRSAGWHHVAAGFTIYCAGEVIVALDLLLVGPGHWGKPAGTAVGMLGWPLMIRGARRVVASGKAYLDREALIDASIITVGIAYVGWYTVILPQVERNGFLNFSALASTAFWTLSVLVFGLLVAKAMAPDVASASLWFFAVAAIAGGSSAAIYRGVEFDHAWQSAPITRITMAVAFAAIVGAAWHPSMRAVSSRDRDVRIWPPVVAVGVGVSVLCVGLFLAALGVLPAPEVDVPGMAASAVVVVLLVARIGLTLQAREAAKTEITRKEARYRSLVEHAFDGTLLADRDGVVRWGSSNTGMVTGRGIDLMQDRSLFEELDQRDLGRFVEEFQQCVADVDARIRGTARLAPPGGAVRWVEYSLVNQLDNDAVAAVVVNYRDVTDQQHVRDALVHQATHDQLTGLPNRQQLIDRLEVVTTHQPPGHAAVLFMDLDHFKVINDSLGHHAGDRLLVAVAERLRRTVGDRGTVARLGGDEFVILTEDISGSTEAVSLAGEICDALDATVTLGAHEVSAHASIGVALHTTAEDTPVSLLREADTAMYRAKEQGRNGFVVYDGSWAASTATRLSLESALRRALEHDLLELHYQPIVDLVNGRTLGFEALLRWSGDTLGGPTHPTLTRRPTPLDVITLAEESGLIYPLGEWVVQRACADLAHLLRQAHDHNLFVSINVSGLQLRRHGFGGVVHDALTTSGIPADRLMIELTESVLVEQSSAAQETMNELRRQGVRLAMDDFGTGYSALTNLKRFPFTTVKIDRGFVEDLDGPDADSGVVRAVLGMAAALDLRVVAEGVSTEAQRQALEQLGCTRAQGYLFGRAVPLDDALAMLDTPVVRTA